MRAEHYPGVCDIYRYPDPYVARLRDIEREVARERLGMWVRAALLVLAIVGFVICGIGIAQAQSGHNVKLSWNAVTEFNDNTLIPATDVVTYRVYTAHTAACSAAPPDSAYTAIAGSDGTATTYTVVNAPSGCNWYEATALVAGVESNRSNAANATVSAASSSSSSSSSAPSTKKPFGPDNFKAVVQ